MQIQPSDFHFPSFLQSVTEMCGIQAEQKRIAFIYQIDDRLPEGVRADEKRLRQVLINLLGNAVKFTSKGGVTFKVEVLESDSSDPANQALDKRSPIQKVRFQIEDTGVGISQSQIEKVFMPFEQVGRKQYQSEGTGLGLAISQRLLELMGSRIQILSKPDEGSIFWFDLDLQESSEWHYAARATQIGRVIGYAGEKRRILVVDDRWENRSVISNLLSPIGFDVCEATNGQDGLIQAVSLQPDLIIVDLVMPIVDGFEMIRKVRDLPELCNLVVIASSASVFETDQHESYSAGADEFLPKPISAEVLLDMLKTRLGLEWLYEEKSIEEIRSEDEQEQQPVNVAEIVPPALHHLDSLYKLAKKGDLEGVIEAVSVLKLSGQQFYPFIQAVSHLAESFQVKELQNFIKQFLPEAELVERQAS
jgi:CheY-like chemotaxis protein